MKKVLVFNGSPRKKGNTSHLLHYFIRGANEHTDQIEEIFAQDLELEFCQGCLRCNLLGKCSIHGDDWENIADKIHEADLLAFASPIYFHHVTAQLKKVIDRFRSFIQVEITETGLRHTPRATWNKDFVVLLTMGSSDDSDAQPAIDLFQFMASVMGSENRVHTITANRLAVVSQVIKPVEVLEKLYPKLNLPKHSAKEDFKKNQEVLEQCYHLGKELTSR
jgi:multimeric flavodoxin WrbA